MEGLGINWKILVGQIINFVILLFILKRFVYKPFLAILKKRKDQIAEGIKKSEEADASLLKLKDLEENIQKEGKEKEKGIVKEAEIKAKTKAQEILGLAEQEKGKIIERGKVLAEKEVAEQKENQEKKVLENVVLVAEKFLGEKIDQEKDKKLIEDLLGKLND
jgi:F-type H+-transporting ATPase subunit b